MDTKTIKERAKGLIDDLSTNEAKLILDLLERFNEKKNKKLPGGAVTADRPRTLRCLTSTI